QAVGRHQVARIDDHDVPGYDFIGGYEPTLLITHDLRREPHGCPQLLDGTRCAVLLPLAEQPTQENDRQDAGRIGCFSRHPRDTRDSWLHMAVTELIPTPNARCLSPSWCPSRTSCWRGAFRS